MHSEVEPAANILSEYPAVFDGSLGTLPGTVHFHVDESVQPVVNRPRRLPVTLEKVVAKELDNPVEQGVITPVDEPSEWLSQLAVATRKAGAIRVCIDQTRKCTDNI